MRTINIHDAKTHLSRLVDEGEKGESCIIAKAGKPKLKVTPIGESEVPKKRSIGFMKGTFTLPDDFEQIDKKLDKEIEKLVLGDCD